MRIGLRCMSQPDNGKMVPWVFCPGAVTSVNLLNLHTKVDQFFSKVADKFPEEMVCRKGCSGCCRQSLSLTGVEMARVVAAVLRLAPEAQARLRTRLKSGAMDDLGQVADDFCPLLEDDLCVVYADRPLICRSHGVPIRVVDDRGSIVRDVCPLNFAGELELVDVADEYVLDVERVNQILGVIQHLAADAGEVPSERLSLRSVLDAVL